MKCDIFGERLINKLMNSHMESSITEIVELIKFAKEKALSSVNKKLVLECWGIYFSKSINVSMGR